MHQTENHHHHHPSHLGHRPRHCHHQSTGLERWPSACPPVGVLAASAGHHSVLREPRRTPVAHHPPPELAAASYWALVVWKTSKTLRTLMSLTALMA